MVENAPIFFLESFVFINFATTAPSNKTWWTSENFIPFFKPIYQQKQDLYTILCFFFEIAKALILLSFHLAQRNMVYEVFKCNKCLTFDTGRLLAFTKLPTDTYAAPPCVYTLCSFWRSDLNRDPVSPLFNFLHSDSKPKLETFQLRQRQIK